MITLEEAMTKLGLMGFDEVEKDSKEKGYYPRRSGRTTLMLLEAIIASQKEIVYIRAHTYDYAKDLVGQARRMCVQLGLDPNNIKPLNHSVLLGSVFDDHARARLYD